MRLLLAAHPTVGHTQALRAIGEEARARGAEVFFATTRLPRLPRFVPRPQPIRSAEQVVDTIRVSGFEHLETPFSLAMIVSAARIARTRGYDELGWAIRLFTAHTECIARQLAREVENRGIELVVADFSFFGAWLGAELAKRPFAAVFHSGLPFPSDELPPFGSGLTRASPSEDWQRAQERLRDLSLDLDSRLLAARRALGLPPVAAGILERPYSKTLNVLTTFEAFEPGRSRLSETSVGPILWAGPCLGSRAGAKGDFPWSELDVRDAPLVYVSLGTVFNDQPRLASTLLRGVKRAGARAIVAAGAAYETVRKLAQPGDVVVRFAPQAALLPRVDAVIGHGGNNSTNEALLAGRPLLVVPFGAEQIANAQRVEALAVGRMLSPTELSEETVADGLKLLLSTDLRARADRLATTVPRGDGAPRVVAALEDLVHRFTR